MSHTLNGSFGELYIHAEGNEQQVADMLSLLHERDIAVEVIQHD
nr:NIL domain-containing protein [Escherichia coli]